MYKTIKVCGLEYFTDYIFLHCIYFNLDQELTVFALNNCLLNTVCVVFIYITCSNKVYLYQLQIT